MKFHQSFTVEENLYLLDSQLALEQTHLSATNIMNLDILILYIETPNLPNYHTSLHKESKHWKPSKKALLFLKFHTISPEKGEET